MHPSCECHGGNLPGTLGFECEGSVKSSQPEAFAAKRRALQKPASSWPSRHLRSKHTLRLRSSSPPQQMRVSQSSAATEVSKGGDSGRGGSGKKPSGGKVKGTREALRATAPAFMQDKAKRDVSLKYPQGRRYCFIYHDPVRLCYSKVCQLSHRCPVFMASGDVCKGAHRQYEHQTEIHG